jgi:dihydroorotase
LRLCFFRRGDRDNTKHLAELERLPGCAGIKVFMGSSTGSLLVADDAGLRAVLKVIRRRASFHAEDEPRLNERKNLRVERRRAFASRLARRNPPR